MKLATSDQSFLFIIYDKLSESDGFLAIYNPVVGVKNYFTTDRRRGWSIIASLNLFYVEGFTWLLYGTNQAFKKAPQIYQLTETVNPSRLQGW